MTLAGIEIKRGDGDSYFMNQYKYAIGIEPLPVAADYMGLRSLCHKLGCIGHTRADAIAPVNIM